LPLNDWGYHTPKMEYDKGPRDVPKIERDPDEFICRWCHQEMYVYKETTHEVIMACNGHVRVHEKKGEPPKVQPCPNNVGEHRKGHWRPDKQTQFDTMWDNYLSVNAKNYDTPFSARKVC
jgi:hypothetical protein